MTLKDLSEEEKKRFLTQELLSHWIGYSLVVGMMACLGATMGMLVDRFSAGTPTGYLPWIAALAAIEGIITQSRMRRTADMNLSPGAYTIVEWVVMAIVIRILMYIWLGWGKLMADVMSIREYFLLNFISGDFVFAIIISFVAWISARLHAEDLRELSDDKVLLTIRDGEIASNRGLIRQRITARILAIGFGMVLLTAIANLNVNKFSWDMFQVKVRSANLIVYFVMGLLLMSLAHFAALRAAWAWERIPIDAHIGQRWVVNSLLLLAIIGLIAFILPARYSIGLFEALSYIIFIFSIIIYAIFAIVQLPIFAIVSLFSFLFKNQDTSVINRIPPPPPLPTQTVTGSESTWSPILKAILFWAILITVIVYAIIQFFRQNKGLAQAVGKKRGWRLILQAFAWLRERLTGLRSAVSTMVENGAQRLVNLVRRSRPGDSWNYLSLRNLTPQQRIRFYYLALIRRSAEIGVARQASQTPYEYAQTLSREVGEESQELNELTEAFIEARYSEHAISPNQVGRVRQAWEHLRQVLKGKKKAKNE